MRELDTESIKRVKDFVKEARERELRKEKKERFRKQVGEAVFGIFCVLLGLIALNQGFNICTRFDGNCKSHPEHLLFTPRK
jgi:hypothetical protein